MSGETATAVVNMIVKELLARGLDDLPRREDLADVTGKVAELRQDVLGWQADVGERLTRLESSISGSGEIPAPPAEETAKAKEKPEESWRVVLAKKPAVVFLGLVALALVAVVLHQLGFDWGFVFPSK